VSLLHNGLSGATAARTALDVSSQNISNMMTPGYTRQGAVMSANGPTRPGHAPGDGVRVQALIRFGDDYKTQQLWRASSHQAELSAQQPFITQLQQVMGDASGSLSAGLDGFFQALSAASVEPGSAPLRQQIIDAAQSMAQRFNSLRSVLSNQGESVRQQRVAAAEQISSLARDVAALNGRITASQAAGLNVSDLIDQRSLKVDSLAALVGVQTLAQPDGSLDVSLSAGEPLVVGAKASRLEVVNLPDGGTQLRLQFLSQSTVVRPTGLGGTIGGLQAQLEQVLQPLQEAVTGMAREMAQRINGELAAGFGTDGQPGRALLVFDGASSSRMLSIDDTLLQEQLGLSADATTPGNSERLAALLALQRQPLAVPGLGQVLPGDVHAQLVGRLAIRGQQNDAALQTAQTVRQHAEKSWKATSGVNADEEAIQLVQYQQMYQANMKVIAVANELFDSLLRLG
jgi:flagellar hook-associated protein 1